MGRLLLLLIGIATGGLVALYLVARRDLDEPPRMAFGDAPASAPDVDAPASTMPPAAPA